ncbi:MAG: pseudaminic acid synthase [Succinivibrionaceae bacterium]|nr:pseudaminic acid synthase [Succinivibrionaceae bacterium]
MKFFEDDSPFIIAEMSGNHNQSLEKALKIVDLAAEAGVNALKMQTYTADTITLDSSGEDFFISDPKSLWKGRTLYDLYTEAYTPWEWHKEIFTHAGEKGLKCFSTPFDVTAVEFLEELDCPCYKVASFENTDLPLISAIASTGKPMIVSTGMATISDIDRLLNTAARSGCSDVTLLKCTSCYPAPPSSCNILTIPHMKATFGTRVGISDHTMGIGVSLASIPLGGRVIEKHFTDSRAEGGVDSAFSMEPAEMKMLVEESRTIYEALGQVTYGATEAETSSAKHRRSLYFTRDMKEGEIIQDGDVRSVRPGFGLPTEFIDVVKGRKVTRDVTKGTRVSWDAI